MAMAHSSRRSRVCRAKTNAAEGTSKSLTPNWLELPRDITVAILQKLKTIEILQNVQRVCTQWHSICKEEPLVWTTIDMACLMGFRIRVNDYALICKQAVDRSCGALVDFTVNSSADYQLLDYVTQRCSKIQRLRLVHCYKITDEELCNVANRLPLLEDVELFYCNNITKMALQRFGECCPRLKTLKLNQQGSRYATDRDDEAMTIAKHMPELRHLQLFGNAMTNSSLDAILEGCPRLESLDLRQCFNINLESSLLRKICDERGIRDLRDPDDSTDDYEYDDTLAEDEYVPDDYSPIDSSSDDDAPVNDINAIRNFYSLL